MQPRVKNNMTDIWSLMFHSGHDAEDAEDISDSKFILSLFFYLHYQQCKTDLAENQNRA